MYGSMEESPPAEAKYRPAVAVHGVQMPVLVASQPVRYEPTGQAKRAAHALVLQLSESPPAEVK